MTTAKSRPLPVHLLKLRILVLLLPHPEIPREKVKEQAQSDCVMVSELVM